VFVTKNPVRLTVKFFPLIDEDLLAHAFVLIYNVFVKFSAARAALYQVLRSLISFWAKVSSEVGTFSILKSWNNLTVDFIFIMLLMAFTVV